MFVLHQAAHMNNYKNTTTYFFFFFTPSCQISLLLCSLRHLHTDHTRLQRRLSSRFSSAFKCTEESAHKHTHVSRAALLSSEDEAFSSTVCATKGCSSSHTPQQEKRSLNY